MSGRLNFEQLKTIYRISLDIYNGKKTLKEGKIVISADYGINVNSFCDYYRALQKMLDGGLHRRIIGSELREYYLSRIQSDFGGEALKRALEAYMMSIKYYEETHNKSILHKDRCIYEKYKNMICTQVK